MTVLDIGNNIAPSIMFSPASRTATANSTAIDTGGVSWGVIVISIGNLHATETVTFQVQSSTTSGGTYTAAKKLGTSTDADTAALANADDDTIVVIAVNCRNLDEFVRVSATHSGSNAQVYGVNFIAMPDYTGDAQDPTFDV